MFQRSGHLLELFNYASLYHHYQKKSFCFTPIILILFIFEQFIIYPIYFNISYFIKCGISAKLFLLYFVPVKSGA